MSVKLLAQVWELDVSAHERDVLMAMADHAKHDGTDCYPSVPRIAWMVGKDERSVRRTMAGLRERGIIEPISGTGGGVNAKGRGISVNYTLHLDRAPKKPPFKADVDVRVEVEPKGDAGVRVKLGATLTPEAGYPDTGVRRTLVGVSGEPTTEPTANPLIENKPQFSLTEFVGNSEDPAIWMHELWEQELGNGRSLDLTDSRRKKYRAMFAEQLQGTPDPRTAWRAILWAVKKSSFHMATRAYQMPESLLVNPDRRSTWVETAVAVIDEARNKSNAAANFAAYYHARQQATQGGFPA